MKSIIAKGELAERIRKNISRLDCDDYRAPHVFLHESGWPGDWPGRALLALCAQYEATQRTDARIRGQIESIVAALPRFVNEDGYFGDKLDGPVANEQQLAGNSWFLRGLCAWYRISRDRSVYAMLRHISERLLPAIRPFFNRYSLCPNRGEGEVGGYINENRNGWNLSTDIGCAFIFLDGLTDLYSVLGGNDVYGLIRFLVEKFLSFDYIGCGFQTHAMLTATRGMVRLIRETGDMRYLEAAERNFELYREQATTINYANFNWFSRPSSWTEPCGFVDSLILATELYALTEKTEYLAFANRVFCNAFRTAQRKNGGAGCETCLSEGNDELKVYYYEAKFCCTMRLADGLNYVRENAFAEKKDGLYVLFATGGDYRSDAYDVSVSYDTEARVVHVRVGRGGGPLYLYLPEGTALVTREGTAAAQKHCFAAPGILAPGEYAFTLEIPLRKERRRGKKVFFYADYLLMEKKYADNSPVGFYLDSRRLSPVGDCMRDEEQYGIERYVQVV